MTGAETPQEKELIAHFINFKRQGRGTVDIARTQAPVAAAAVTASPDSEPDADMQEVVAQDSTQPCLWLTIRVH